MYRRNRLKIIRGEVDDKIFNPLDFVGQSSKDVSGRFFYEQIKIQLSTELSKVD